MSLPTHIIYGVIWRSPCFVWNVRFQWYVCLECVRSLSNLLSPPPIHLWLWAFRQSCMRQMRFTMKQQKDGTCCLQLEGSSLLWVSYLVLFWGAVWLREKKERVPKHCLSGKVHDNDILEKSQVFLSEMLLWNKESHTPHSVDHASSSIAFDYGRVQWEVGKRLGEAFWSAYSHNGWAGWPEMRFGAENQRWTQNLYEGP